MLYVTTRNKFDTQTTPKALSADTGADGGLYTPFQMPTFSKEEINSLSEKTFGEAVVDVLNRFFSTKLTAADVDFAVGRFPLRLTSMSHRILIAEVWRNVEHDYACTEKNLATLVCNHLGCKVMLSSWLKIAIRIAVLFGLVGELMRCGYVSFSQPIDISVPTGDFSLPMAVWFGRHFGLPIANIICSCNENSGIWELFHLGELHTDAEAIKTTTPLADFAVPAELERLVHAVGGDERVQQYVECLNKKCTYRPAEELYAQLKKGMFSAVVSRSRVDALIPSVYRTNAYILGSYTALAYGGMMDYRAKTGETRTCLLMAERSPLSDGKIVADSMRMNLSKITEEVMKA